MVPSQLFAAAFGIAGPTELRVGHQTTLRFLGGHLRHLAYFPKRLEDGVVRRVTG